ncbi:MAG TPA: response regulator [Kofleriaceae bacterium]|nr:response regulator [Kofleriaceae bacterium]
MEVPSDHDILLALGEDLPVGIWIARVPDGELIYANRTCTDILGFTARYDSRLGGFVEPHNVCTRDGAPYPQNKMPFVRAMTERRVVIADDLAIRRGDGRQLDVRAIARPVGNPLTHVVVTLLDVGREVAAERARAEAEQRLRRAQRLEAIGSLATGIAHDFNNLIFSIKLIAAEAAASETDPKRRATMDLIDDVTERSAALTRALLGFVRRSKQRTTPVSLNDLVTSMTELLGRTLPGIDLSFELEASDRGSVVGDPAQLEQLIMALVLSARDAVPMSGRIVVRTADRGGGGDPAAPRSVVLEVLDDGGGIPAELRQQELQALVSTKAQGGATEVSSPLAPVFGIIESHGGTIELGAGLDGAGTAIRVILPGAPRQPVGRTRVSLADLPKGSGLVLVVDDDNLVRKVLTSSLGSLGYKTIEATSGPQAIAIYRQRHAEIRAVVLDMVMPGMAGRETYLGLREIERNVAVLLMSGHTLNEQVQEILDLGVRSFVTKPYSIAMLATAMAELTK